MGGDSHSKGRWFESCCKKCIVCLKKTENKRKRGRDGPFFLKKKFEDRLQVIAGIKLTNFKQSDENIIAKMVTSEIVFHFTSH